MFIQTLMEAKITLVGFGVVCSALLINIPSIFVMITLCSLLGVIMYGYYAPMKCDPLKSGRVSDPNQVNTVSLFHSFIYSFIHSLSKEICLSRMHKVAPIIQKAKKCCIVFILFCYSGCNEVQ